MPVPTFADSAADFSWGFGADVIGSDHCCGGKVHVKLTLTLAPPPMGGIMPVAVVPLAPASAAPAGGRRGGCRHRSDDPAPAAEVAKAGLYPLRVWYTCGRPGFARLGRLVAECDGEGVPADRRCSPSGCRHGYESTDAGPTDERS